MPITTDFHDKCVLPKLIKFIEAKGIYQNQENYDEKVQRLFNNINYTILILAALDFTQLDLDHNQVTILEAVTLINEIREGLKSGSIQASIFFSNLPTNNIQAQDLSDPNNNNDHTIDMRIGINPKVPYIHVKINKNTTFSCLIKIIYQKFPEISVCDVKFMFYSKQLSPKHYANGKIIATLNTLCGRPIESTQSILMHTVINDRKNYAANLANSMKFIFANNNQMETESMNYTPVTHFTNTQLDQGPLLNK